MSLRVIAGEFRGRPLRTLPGRATRPLLGRVREAVFSILGERIVGAEVWDLFAGTGASGIEALSRGARHVVFVERGRGALGVLHANLALFGDRVAGRSEVLRADAWRPPSGRDAAPDVVFFDPPYPDVAKDPEGAVARVCELAARLAPDGVLCFHFPAGDLDCADFDGGLETDVRQWGSSAVAFLTRRS